jgi:hypothetical protein
MPPNRLQRHQLLPYSENRDVAYIVSFQKGKTRQAYWLALFFNNLTGLASGGKP